MNSRVRIGLTVAITLLAVVSCTSPGVTVTVNNASNGEITLLQIKFTGGSKSFVKLKPAETFETKVSPNGSSHLVIEFVDASGKQHSAKLDVYFERGYKGAIHVTIQSDGKVTW